MATTEATLDINLDEIQAQISGLSKEDLIKQLVDVKVRQKVTQKKYYNPESAKKARLKRTAVINAMVEKAKALGIYQGILDTASAKADEELGASEAEEAAKV